jgi:uncharacterized membrane protein
MPEAAPSSRLVSVRNAFISGALLVAPLFVTILVFGKIIDLVGGPFRDLFFFYVPDTLRDRPSLSLVWDILSTLIVMVGILALGYLSRWVLGKYFFSVGERLFLRIPGMGGIYTIVKQVVNTFSAQNRTMFNKAVLVEYPRKGCWSVGFLTNTAQGEAQARTGQEVWTVFIPTTPNPTSGFLLLLPRNEVVELEMSAGEAMKLIISGGAISPPWPAARPEELAK